MNRRDDLKNIQAHTQTYTVFEKGPAYIGNATLFNKCAGEISYLRNSETKQDFCLIIQPEINSKWIVELHGKRKIQ